MRAKLGHVRFSRLLKELMRVQALALGCFLTPVQVSSNVDRFCFHSSTIPCSVHRLLCSVVIRMHQTKGSAMGSSQAGPFDIGATGSCVAPHRQSPQRSVPSMVHSTDDVSFQHICDRAPGLQKSFHLYGEKACLRVNVGLREKKLLRRRDVWNRSFRIVSARQA